MNLGLPVAETVARTREAIARLRLEPIIRRDPARLSGGQAQLVGIASLLAMRPRHLILDEPTAQLDPAGTRLVGEALRTLAEAGTSLLIAEHKTDLLDGLCSRGRGDRRRADRPRRTDDRGLRGPGAARSSGSSRRRACGSLARSREAGHDPDIVTDALSGGRLMSDANAPTAHAVTRAPILQTEDLVHVYGAGLPTEARALDGVDLAIRQRRARGHRRPERVRQVDARAPLQRPPPADRGAGPRRRRGRRGPPRRASRRDGRAGVPGSGSPDLRAGGPRRGGVRAAEPGPERPRARRPRSTEPSPRPGSTADGKTNPYDLGYSRRKLLALASILAMGTPVVDPRRADDRPGRARRGARSGASSRT